MSIYKDIFFPGKILRDAQHCKLVGGLIVQHPLRFDLYCAQYNKVLCTLNSILSHGPGPPQEAFHTLQDKANCLEYLSQ